MAMLLYAGVAGKLKNKNAWKVQIAAEYCGVELKVADNFEFGVTNKTSDFTKMNPIGKAPVLVTSDGPLFESNAISRYIARLKPDSPLYGSSLIDYARVEQWIDFASMEVDINVLRWFKPRMGYIPYLLPVEDTAIDATKRALGALNTYLASNTHLVGNSVTLADIVLICNLYLGFAYVMTKSFTLDFPNVERYFWKMVNEPNFKKIMGDIEQPESYPPVYTTPFLEQ